MNQTSGQLKIISFLGSNKKYEEVPYLHPNYQHNQIKVITPFYQEALVEFYQPQTLYVLLTPTAEERNWEKLAVRLEGKVDLQPIKNIPENNTPEDIWTIFDRVTDCLQSGDRVIFDITHSFRSIPIVALLAASYLRVVRQVQIEGLLYGAYEARNQETNETPSFDLFPIVSLLDWTTATDQFIQTGNGQALASLLKNSKGANENTENLANNLNKITLNLEMLRPADLMSEAAKLSGYIRATAPTVSQDIPPFATLLKRVESDYGRFGLTDTLTDKERAREALVKQLNMVEWYVDKQQIVQALSIAREWLPSLLCYYFDLDALNGKNRSEMEFLLNRGGKYKDDAGNTTGESEYAKQWQEITKTKKKPLNKLWTGDFDLANLRNDVLHAGYRKNHRAAEDILEQTQAILEQLKAIALQWEIIDSNNHS